MTLQRSLMALVAVALFAGLIPLAVVLEQRLETALEQKAREDLELAPLVLQSRVQDLAGSRMMHAKELGATPGLATALANGEHERAVSLLAAAPAYPGERPLLVGPGAESLMGPLPPGALLDQTREGGMPVQVILLGDSLLATVAIAPVMHDGSWVGTVGIWTPVDMDESAHLAAPPVESVPLRLSDIVMAGPWPTNEPPSRSPRKRQAVSGRGRRIFWAWAAPRSGGR